MNELLSPTVEYAARWAGAGTTWGDGSGVRVDLHCHSTFSTETLRWLPGLAYQPLCEPEELYDLAKARGMDFVTITDHDTLDGCRTFVDRRGWPPDFFFGEEVSARFPEDGTVVHVNVFDHDEQEHREIQRLRDNIYDLVHYLRQRGRLYVLNHMTWTAQHRVLPPARVAAMLELFDVFEGLNGTRSYAHNAFAWHATRGHGKVLVAGSDSHSNRVGTTYTRSLGSSPRELLDNIRAGRAACCGGFGTAEKLREDVWMVLQKNIERQMAAATSGWQRFLCRAVRRTGQAMYPLVCLGYHKYQDVLIRGFVQAWPA